MNSLSKTVGDELTPLICIERIEETADAATFIFQTPDAAPLNFKAGQFVVFQGQSGQPGDMLDFRAGDFHFGNLVRGLKAESCPQPIRKQAIFQVY